MPSPPPAPSPAAQTFSEQLAGRPRARFFTVFTILGFAVTPAAVAMLLFTAPGGDPGASTGGEKPVRIEAVFAAVLIALHLLCAFFAWHFWREEAPKPSDRETD